MDNPIQNTPGLEELQYEQSFGSIEAAETTEETSMSVKDHRHDGQYDCPSACLPRARSTGARNHDKLVFEVSE